LTYSFKVLTNGYLEKFKTSMSKENPLRHKRTKAKTSPVLRRKRGAYPSNETLLVVRLMRP
jgi:hypothetical protein